jgi:F-type H+-transporting ATPase subunit gamma
MKSIQQIVDDIASHRDVESPFFNEPADDKACIVVIAGDRGLAGHYNAAVFKIADELINSDCVVLPIGKKAVDRYTHRGATILSGKYIKAEYVTSSDCREMAELLIQEYLAGRFSRVMLIDTTFVSAMTQNAQTTELLPIKRVEQASHHSQMIMEPAPEQLLDAVMPDYLTGCLYGAVCDAVACEMASRRNAMDSATKNADQMIADLSLHYNRARQGSITQEITEIVAGAEQ